MMLPVIILVPLVGGLLAWASQRVNPRVPRWVALVSLIVNFILVVSLWVVDGEDSSSVSHWFAEFEAPWVSQVGIGLHLGVDGLSLILIGLTAFLGCIAVLASWSEVREKTGFFSLCLCWTLAGVLGVFLALDLFLFYFAWELMLVPMFFLIAVWGHEDRFRASVKFFIFTQLSGLLMLVAIVGIYLLHGRSTGVYTFDYVTLLGSTASPRFAALLYIGFLGAFLVKMPAVPFHAWLPDAHTQAPTAGSVILAGLLLKTGAYGLLRFAIPLFPGAADRSVTVLAILGVSGILYGAFLAFSQDDMKRLVAYTSVSHMGFVLLGLIIGDRLAFQGAIIQIVSHGLSTGALFVIVGALQERLGTRDLREMGGLWSIMPRAGGSAMFFALAALGLPGLGNFVGEFLVVLGAFRVSPVLAAIASVGFVLSTAYALRMMHRAFFGKRATDLAARDFGPREMLTMALLMIPLLWLGLYPRWFIERTAAMYHPAVSHDHAVSAEEAPR